MLGPKGPRLKRVHSALRASIHPSVSASGSELGTRRVFVLSANRELSLSLSYLLGIFYFGILIHFGDIVI